VNTWLDRTVQVSKISDLTLDGVVTGIQGSQAKEPGDCLARIEGQPKIDDG
jgi:hypothetical protein